MFTFRHHAVVTLTPAPIREEKSDVALTGKSLGTPGLNGLTSRLRLSRRKNETDFSVETLCHDPSTPLYGVMLDDYNSSTCVMKEKNTTSGAAHVCSCTDEDECNDRLLFTPGE